MYVVVCLGVVPFLEGKKGTPKHIPRPFSDDCVTRFFRTSPEMNGIAFCSGLFLLVRRNVGVPGVQSHVQLWLLASQSA